MIAHWNHTARDAMTRRSLLNTPWNDGEAYGAAETTKVVYVDAGTTTFVWGVLTGAAALAAGYLLPQAIRWAWLALG